MCVCVCVCVIICFKQDMCLYLTYNFIIKIIVEIWLSVKKNGLASSFRNRHRLFPIIMGLCPYAVEIFQYKIICPGLV